MSHFEPGEGWRKLRAGERDQDEMIVHYSDEGSTTWVREAPVQPLPTEPYTVIRTKGRKGFSDWVLTLNEHGHWAKHDAVISAAELPRLITSFEVLAEPRAVTAKAVLDRVLHLSDTGSYADEAVHQVRGEFGVSS